MFLHFKEFVMRENGRSMVEMLGVLAIIGVLSIGAISGYSTAMERYKLNKYADNYNYFFNELLTHKDGMISHDTVNKTQLNAVINKLGLAVDFDHDYYYFYDNLGGYFSVYTRSSRFVMDYHLENRSAAEAGDYSFHTDVCKNMIMNVLKPLHEAIIAVKLYRTGDEGFGDFAFQGDSVCTAGTNCLYSVTLQQADNFCAQCLSNQWCIISISF